ncbi:hypothetical protein OBBRIDRAFT_837141 [Obba rivulosa]|uniref:Uncharacterized protein n=1 Tax=Obba rivulosa TaxID=1052685 RepID=A0A8E2ANF2_9APHY|nr:hypothetical protein OBBRIDRAFT_837141 [Obba rivulosa]
MDSVGWFPRNRFSSLTCLRLTDSRPLNKDVLPSLMLFLTHCPGLQDLFVRLITPESPAAFRGARAVALPHLRRLSIGLSSFPTVREFLSYLEVPTDLALRVHLMPDQKLPHLDVFARMGVLKKCTQMGMTFSNTLIITVVGAMCGVRLESAALAHPSAACRSWICSTRDADSYQWEILALHVDELWITALNGHACHPALLEEALALFPSLSSIHIHGNWSPMDIQTILGKVPNHRGTYSFRCPNLTALDLWQQESINL